MGRFHSVHMGDLHIPAVCNYIIRSYIIRSYIIRTRARATAGIPQRRPRSLNSQTQKSESYGMSCISYACARNKTCRHMHVDQFDGSFTWKSLTKLDAGSIKRL